MGRARGALARDLEAFYAGMIDRLDQTSRDMVVRGAQVLAQSDVGAQAPREGDMAPDFELMDSHGRAIRLSDQLRDGPVIVMFVRGSWCPFCSTTLRAYQDELPEFRKAGAQVLAIAPEALRGCMTLIEREMLGFHVLSDTGNRVATRYNIDYELPLEVQNLYRKLGHDLPKLNESGDWRVPLPATFAVAPDGHVALAHVERVIHRRLDPKDALETVRRIRAATPTIAAPA